MERGSGLGCDGCRVCCELIGVPEINKPRGEMCPHATDTGCGIHPTLGGTTQPISCGLFYCLWLASQRLDEAHRMPPSMRPDRSHMVFGPCDEKIRNKLYVNVDPKFPDAWREPEAVEWLNRLVAKGNEVVLFVGDHSANLKIGRRTVRQS